jgi:hypothetical protein
MKDARPTYRADILDGIAQAPSPDSIAATIPASA